MHLTEGAWAELEVIYKSQNITPSSVIARLVDHHIRRVKERAAQKMDQATRLDLTKEPSPFISSDSEILEDVDVTI